MFPLLAGHSSLSFGARDAEPLLTRAEKSEFKATATHADVMSFCEALARESEFVELLDFGASGEGRTLPLLVLSRPGVASLEEARAAGKPVILCYGNIHGGEVCGKEALLMLARELARGSQSSVLDEFIVLLAPLLNADGNERFSKDNRPGQVGPEEGMGRRENAAGLDLNRDFIKLEAPETRALVRLLNQWDPLLVIDTHTTNGSRHRYVLTYDGPRHPAGDERLIEFAREKFLPKAAERMVRESGYDSFFYGNFSGDYSRWEAYPALPRYGGHYLGLRNRLAILSEAYAYAPFRERVLATRAFVSACLEVALAQKEPLRSRTSKADEQIVRLGGKGEGRIAIRAKTAPLESRVTVKGFEVREAEGEAKTTDQPKDYELEHWGGTETTKDVVPPYAYLIAVSLPEVVANLQRHGIKVEELREDIDLDIETYQVETITRAERLSQNHRLATLTTSLVEETIRFKAGTTVIRTGQELGRLAVCLLEPEAEDGLAAWNFFDFVVHPGQPFPVRRLAEPFPLLTTAVRPLPEDRTFGRRVTFKTLYGEDRVDFTGDPARVDAWLESGRHYLQARDGALRRVEAATGQSEPFFAAKNVAKALSRLPALAEEAARAVSRRTRFEMNPKRTGALFEHENDLYFFRFDGSVAVRLTSTPEEEELAAFSPDGAFVAFVRGHDLYVVDLKTQTERALTTDGDGDVRNGKADWVYFEEIFNRNWKAYWWSPDSQRIAFLQFDASVLPMFHALYTLPLHGRLESMRHPKAGDPNPAVKLGTVTVAGGPVRWADLSDYLPGSFLISQVGWMPGGKAVFGYVQDRIQSWLDFVVFDTRGIKEDRFFREKTEAWVDNPGDPHFLEAGGFLLPSERTGWRHLYRFQPKTKEWETITSGQWEVREVQLVDEENGWIYFTATRDSHIAENLYRCKLDGSSLERLTRGNGHHRISIDLTGGYFVDSSSDFETPEQVRLFQTDGRFVRTLDSNPVYVREEFQFGQSRLTQIKSKDGFHFEASMVKPPDFEPEQKYPVWFMTYGGPHYPSIRNAWGTSRIYDQMLAAMGIVAFRMDPRSASGKGAVSTWTAYRQLGVQELADITEAIEWLTAQPFVDGTRLGMSGHSYGGFMTAYALTHSRLFAAGIAGAPVTDWRYYDTIYTERYMDTPQNNPDGYEKTSVVKAAKNLHGRLLLLHGMVDDNVHLQNSTALMDALQKAGKTFEVMFYPESKHGLSGNHYHRMTVDFIRQTMGVETVP